jgi:hypothetical protein
MMSAYSPSINAARQGVHPEAESWLVLLDCRAREIGIIDQTTSRVTMAVMMAMPGMRKGHRRTFMRGVSASLGIWIRRSSVIRLLPQLGQRSMFPPVDEWLPEIMA